MNPLIVVVATLLGCFLVRSMFSKQVLDRIIPWMFAYTFLVICVVGTVETKSGVFHFFITALNFIPVLIICSRYRLQDVRRNPTWATFVLFYAYMVVIAFTGYYPIDGPAYFVQIFLTSFLTGHCVARWCCQTEGALRKLLMPLLLVSVVCVAYYVFNMGALSAQTLDDLGRIELGEVDSETANVFNPNQLALIFCSILPFVLLSFKWTGRWAIVQKLVALACTLLLGLVLVRTGSRNGALGLLPSAWYFIHLSKSGKINGRYLVLGIAIGFIFLLGVFMTNKGVEKIRFFDFQGSQQEFYGDTLNRMSTGRWEMYHNSIAKMTSRQKCFGAGAALSQYSHMGELVTRFRGGNAHSIYVTVFLRTGFIGTLLFLIVIVQFFVNVRRIGRVRGQIAMMLFSIWLMTGVGESSGMLGGLTAILAGMGMGLVSLKPAINSEFGECAFWRPHYRGERF